MMTRPKEMSGEEFGLALLVVFENNPNEGTKQLVAGIRKVLGIKEPEHYVPAPFVQKVPLPEFPQWRIKYNASGEEIARRRVDSMHDLERLFHSEKEFVWQQSFAVPIEENR